ncbi:Chase2 sensor protein [Nostocales cyanobacterium HT-58-2]|nr:Chase2 sensor protein [Nostocales cyanobacterium HT-58-2]
MSKQIVLNLGKGNLQQGFPTVVAQLWQADAPTPMQFTGGLPAAPELESFYQLWQQLYAALYASLSWRSQQVGEFEIEEEDVTHISQAEFEKLSQELQLSLNDWLNASAFLNIDRKLRTQLTPTDEIRLMITAQSDQVLKLPWCLWHFFTDYPQAEIALSPTEFTRSIKTVARNPKSKVKILAILGDGAKRPPSPADTLRVGAAYPQDLGDRQRINIETDRKLLQQLPNVELKFLVEPNRAQLTEQLWESGWDILFFAGHSSSQSKGQIQINQTESLTIDQLRYGLQKAIARGLKLAIFNSCDGLGLARDLADLHLPQVIVMREPVPDKVAQEFLKHFLATFSRGQSLYTAVREAREKLQSLEGDFPCATWLPVICQNPAEIPINWQELRGRRLGIQLPKPNTRQLPAVFISSLIITIIFVVLRGLGTIQPLEWQAFDLLMRSRPESDLDPRLLIVTITEEDIQSQGTEPRQGSLSDKHLNLLLTKLEQYQPQVIGLDIYRDFPVSSSQPELAKRMQKSDRLIAICKTTDVEQDPTGITPPPEIPVARLGFSDFVEDNDGVLRRHLLQISPELVSPCVTDKAFNVQLAFRYLKAQGISAEFTQAGLKLGNTTYERLKSPTLGYQSVDTNGFQLLLNYRSSPRNVAQQVTLNQIISGEINPSAFKDKIVLIGVTSASSGDYWSTPYGSGFAQRTPGVFLQAQMVSQLVSAALDKRPLLWALPQWGEFSWIWVWSLTGGLIAWCFHRNFYLIITLSISVGTLSGICFVLLVLGCYLPLISPILTLFVTSAQVAYIIKKFNRF